MEQTSSRYFSRIAKEWDNLRKGYFGPGVMESALAHAYLRPEMTAADIGAGTGFIAAGLAPLVARVHVVDGSAEMLDVARENLSGFENVEFHVAEGTHLPFEDGQLDVVFANMFLHHMPDPLAAIQEMARVLRPGGRLVITDMDAHTHAWLKEEMADVWQGFERPQIRAWFEEAGLVNVIVDCTGETCSAQSEDQSDLADITVFVATGVRRIAMRSAVRENYTLTVNSNCGCGSDCCGGASNLETLNLSGYTPIELSAAPGEAAAISYACGNPTAMAGLRPGETVLDIGSGGGLDAFLAAARVGPEGRVIGIDMTPALLERARAAAEKNGIQNVEFRQGFAESLPVEDGSVDVIISNCVINLTEDKGQVFREAFRVLKSGGRLEVSDTVASKGMPLSLRHNASGWSECTTGSLPEKEYLDLIAQAGFKDIRTQRNLGSGTIEDVEVYSTQVSALKPLE